MYKTLPIPWCGWFSISSTYSPSCWTVETGRGRTKGWELHITLGVYQLSWHGRGQPYWKLVGLDRQPSVDWMLDEFDSSFNEFAAASLRYHLDFAVTCNEDRRELYEDLIARLGERCEYFTDAEIAELSAIRKAHGGDFIRIDPANPKAGSLMRKSTPREAEIYALSRERELAWETRNNQARHDFVDIMRQLWS